MVNGIHNYAHFKEVEVGIIKHIKTTTNITINNFNPYFGHYVKSCVVDYYTYVSKQGS